MWSVLSTPEVRISHPLSSPQLNWFGKWRLKNETDEQNVELELAYDQNKVSGALKCGDHQEVIYSKMPL